MSLYEERDLQPLVGWLGKLEKTILRYQWRRLYFILEGDKLYYFKSDTHLEHLGVIDLRAVTHVLDEKHPKVDDPFQFKLVVSNLKNICLLGKSKEDMEFWVHQLRKWKIYFEEEYSKTHKKKMLIQSKSDLYHDDQNYAMSLPANFSKYDYTEDELHFSSSESQEIDFSQDVGSLSLSMERINQTEYVTQLQQKLQSKDKKIRELENIVKRLGSMTSEKDQVEESYKTKLEQQNEKIKKLEITLKEKDIEILRFQNIIKHKRQREESVNSQSMESDDSRYEILKEKYFFQKALNMKLMNPSLLQLNINAMYDVLNEQDIPFDEWDEWIFQQSSRSEFNF